MGEEEATMRERLAEAMARIICRAAHMKQPDVIAHGPDIWRPGELEAKVDAYWPKWASDAETALDAALDVLETNKLIYREDGQVVHELRGAPNDIWQAMLATLRSPKI